MDRPDNVVSYERFRIVRALSDQCKLRSEIQALLSTLRSLQGELLEMERRFSRQQSVFEEIRDDCRQTLEFCRECEQIAGSTDDIERMERERDRLVWRRALRNLPRPTCAAAEI